MLYFFFSSRRRHTRCALVTGVQTCALPILVTVRPDASIAEIAHLLLERRISAVPVVDLAGRLLGIVSEGDLMRRPESGTGRHPSWRSDERRVGKECASTCRSRWSPYH